MEESIPRGGIFLGGHPYEGFNLQRPMHFKMHGFPVAVVAQKKSGSEEDEPSFTEDGASNQFGLPKAQPWHRVKWTDDMVRLLITAVSYTGAEVASESGRRKFVISQKKGKWKSVSKVMAERGFHVLPQQCEDKFNDLNKRYKKLNEILGRGTSCEVVENPALLDIIDFLTEKEKDDVRKILSSKHLFYEEMCSFHNRNRLHLPHDPALQRSLQLALKSRDDDDHYENGEIEDYGEGCCPAYSKNCSSVAHIDKKQNHWSESRVIRLEEQKLQYHSSLLELERQRLKWAKLSRKRDRELEVIRVENEKMKLENKQMAMELKRKELGENFIL